jgi:pimeloyl-ACP methyl ester carboxylesterase
MPSPLNGLLERLRLRPRLYGRRPPLVLLNGLAEQAESWYRNRRFWTRYFEVLAPNILVYEGDAIHQRIADKLPIDVDYLVGQLHTYLTQFVQTPPFHIVSSSLGGKVAVEFAVRYPQLVNRLVLLCPSGMGDTERLPIMDGVKGSDPHAMVKSVFYKPRVADREVLRYYKAKFPIRRWKAGFLKTVRGTLEYSVRDKLKDVKCPTLLVSGLQDKVCDPKTAQEAARELPVGQFLGIPKCGHAPQIEKSWLINRLVVNFLSAHKPTARLSWTERLFGKPRRRPPEDPHQPTRVRT